MRSEVDLRSVLRMGINPPMLSCFFSWLVFLPLAFLPLRRGPLLGGGFFCGLGLRWRHMSRRCG